MATISNTFSSGQRPRKSIDAVRLLSLRRGFVALSLPKSEWNEEKWNKSEAWIFFCVKKRRSSNLT
ncbi:hypothetical protein CRN36_13350 [Vibrio vulnificus]|nr:hypothetical protein CRN36_13350 [Vibrio vulnificus]